jgi:hypothetical protein
MTIKDILEFITLSVFLSAIILYMIFLIVKNHTTDNTLLYIAIGLNILGFIISGIFGFFFSEFHVIVKEEYYIVFYKSM